MAESRSIRDVPLCIAIDKSGSTWGKTLEEEMRSILEICSLRSSNSDSPVLVLPWCDTVDEPISLPSQAPLLRQITSGGGTDPGVLYSSPFCVKALETCGLWFLLTDGQIDDRLIQSFALTTADLRLHGKPCVIIIFGHASHGIPAHCNISVGISLYAVAPDCLFLFHDIPTGNLSILQAKGSFRALVPELRSDPSAQLHLDEYTAWAELPHITYQNLRHVSVGPVRNIGVEDIALQNGLVVNMRDLYSADMNDEQVSKLFQDEDNLKSVMLAEMTRGREGEWMSWLDKLEQPVPTLTRERKDIDQMAQKTLIKLMEALNSEDFGEEDIEALRYSLRKAHEANLVHLNNTVVASYNQVSAACQSSNSKVRATKRKSNNAWNKYKLKKAPCMHQAPIEEESRVKPLVTQEGLDSPLFLPGFNRRNPSRELYGKCMLCHQRAILTLLLKTPPKTMTTNFPCQGSYTALAFPMAMSNFAETDILSNSICCDSCAFHLVQNYRSLHGETVVGALPLVSVEENKDAFLDALDKAFKGRFQRTDLFPLFIAVLDRKITGDSAHDVPPDERFLYTQALIWMKQSMVEVAEVSIALSQSFGKRQDRRKTRTLSLILSERFTLDPSDPDNEDVSILRYPLPGFMVLIRLLQEQGFKENKIHLYLFQRLFLHVTETFFTLIDQSGWEQAELSVTQILQACLMQDTAPETVLQGGSTSTAIAMEQFLVHSLIDLDTLASFRTMADFAHVEERMGPAANVYLCGLKNQGSTFSTAIECFNGLKAHAATSTAILKPLAISPGLCVDMIRELDRALTD